MSNEEAKMFLMKSESYSNVNLPEYFNFNKVLAYADDVLDNRSLNSLMVSDKEKHYYKINGVNYTLIANKDGKYSWRPLQLIHPLIYVDLVNLITEDVNWNKIVSSLKKAQSIKNIKCVSLPVESQTNKRDIGETILNWWEQFEQEQIKLALKYKYCIHTDIADCYGSIYTHSIPWAIHSKEYAKKNQKEGIGNKIDQKIQRMQYSQTNGIPQGSVLMDLIAEIVLAGVDIDLSEVIEHYDNEVFILRYRDDYRIFSNQRNLVEKVIKDLTEILLEWNFKLNSSKTFLTDDIIKYAVKEDKMHWMLIKASLKNDGVENKFDKFDKYPYKISLQKYLLQINMFAEKFPNSGSLKTALTDFYKYIYKLKSKPNDIHQLISITTNIMERNPNVIEYCVAILSKILTHLSIDEKVKIVESIKGKFDFLPNTEFVEIWLQRLTLPYNRSIKYNSKLCKKVCDPKFVNIWKSNWIAQTFEENLIIDEEKIDSLSEVIHVSQIDYFNQGYLV